MIYYDEGIANNQAETHGDKITRFIEDLYKEYNIYYYDASSSKCITDESIIAGLEWMKVLWPRLATKVCR